MTGFRSWRRGRQLPEGIDHGLPDDRHVEERANRHRASHGALLHFAATSMRCSTIGPRASAGTYVSAPTRITTPIRSTTNSGVCVGSVPGPVGTVFFLAREPAMASTGIGQPVASEQHGEAEGGVVEGRVRAEAGERAAVVVGRRGERVEHLAEAVRAGIQHARLARGRDHADRRPDQHERRRDEDHEGRHLHLVGLDLLAEVFGRAPDHEARTRTRPRWRTSACRRVRSPRRRRRPRRAGSTTSARARRSV